MTQARNLADLSQAYTAGQFPGKNKIINPCGVINQRGVGSVSQGYSHDRWHFAVSGNYAAKILMTPSTGANGFSAISDSYFYVYCVTQFTGLAAGDYAMVRQFIEGYNTVDLLWGTIFAKPITISFKATGTGLALPFTIGVSVRNTDYTRSYVAPVVITGQGRYSVTIPGCIDGTWDKTNTSGLELAFCLGCGSTYITPAANAWQAGSYIGVSGQSNIAASTTNTISLTDVQLEVGRFATPIDARSVQHELDLCYRYAQLVGNGAVGRWFSTNDIEFGFQFKVSMRATPTAVVLGNGSYTVTRMGTNSYSGTGMTVNYFNGNAHGVGSVSLRFSATGATAGEIGGLMSSPVLAIAEL